MRSNFKNHGHNPILYCNGMVMDLKEYKGIYLPDKMKIRSWIILGPPGSGKSFLMKRISGWHGEVCIDIAQKRWWKVEVLTHRPREIHLAIPFKKCKTSLPVYDDSFSNKDQLPEVDYQSIVIPHKKKFIAAPNWRARFVFDFILPPPDWLFENRDRRFESKNRKLMDKNITREWVDWQVEVHWKIAWHFHQAGLQVLVRPFNVAIPYRFSQVLDNLKNKPKKDTHSVFPKGVDIGYDLQFSDWTRTSSKTWRKSAGLK